MQRTAASGVLSEPCRNFTNSEEPRELTLRTNAGMTITQSVMKALTMQYTVPDEKGKGPLRIQVHPLAAVEGKCNNVGKVAALVAETIMQ